MSKDCYNNEEFSEYQIILDEEFEKANKLQVDDCVTQTLKLIRKFSKKLSDNDSYKYHELMKSWYNKEGI